MRVLAHANPLTYGADLLRFGLLDVHEIDLVIDVTMLSVLACGALLIAVSAFKRVRT
jgi:ABC-type multidrug transport system permease subunit